MSHWDSAPPPTAQGALCVSPEGQPGGLPGLARPRSARQCHVPHQLHPACPQAPPTHAPAATPCPLQHWSRPDWHLHRAGQYDAEDGGRRLCQHPPVCLPAENPATPVGPGCGESRACMWYGAQWMAGGVYQMWLPFLFHCPAVSV